MTEIAIRNNQAAAVPDQAAAPGTDLILWARQAEAAALFAERVCSTAMVPKAYFGKTAEAAAAILKGAELGFGPMASLNAFDNINGTPAPKAITLRAVVLGKGHDVETVEQSATKAVVRGRRKGSTDWQTSTWDIARAKKLPQFKTNPNYTNNPEAMLVARATAEVCRWVGADAVMGMPYAAEELQDQQAIEAPAVRRLTVAELDAAPAEPQRETWPTTPCDGKCGNDDPHDAHLALLTDGQRKHMFALWGELGFTGEENREQRLAITAKILGLPELESSSELTRAEADTVIAALIERRDRTAGETA